MKKRLLSMFLVLVLALMPTAFAAEGLENFRKTTPYAPGQFADVDAGAWYAGSVQSAVE